MRQSAHGLLLSTAASLRRFAVHPGAGTGSVWLALALAGIQPEAVAAPLLQPSSDEQVIEVLPAVTRGRPAPSSGVPKPANPLAAQMLARQDIGVARQTGDTRYWGRAQAVLAPWWDHPDAPADIAVLQATVQQGRHEFEASRKILAAVLARSPSHAQGWLDMAALERLSGHYPEALAACEAVARAGQAFYATACRLETQSLQGRHETAVQGLQALIAQTSDNSQRSWLLSLLAESQERWGRDAAAAKSYTGSLALDPDLYTAIAYSDLLLRTGKPVQALQALAALPETDAVVLRRSAAWRRLGDARWTGARAMLKERTAELRRRGDDPMLHARELALAALWLDDDGADALVLARRNLLLQHEPIDWWIALLSARQAGDGAALAEIDAAIAATGLQDSRLDAARRQPMPAPGKAK
jgi:tetratricopeptide (TPR) repeat protein